MDRRFADAHVAANDEHENREQRRAHDEAHRLAPAAGLDMFRHTQDDVPLRRGFALKRARFSVVAAQGALGSERLPLPALRSPPLPPDGRSPGGRDR